MFGNFFKKKKKQQIGLSPRGYKEEILQLDEPVFEKVPTPWQFIAKKIAFYLFIFLFLAGIFFVGYRLLSFWLMKAPPLPVKNFGVTFSKTQAEDLGLDWREAYKAVLGDLDVSLLRIPAYWTEIEPEDNKFDFEWLDFTLSEAASSSADVILAVGRKLPRWPECHEPYWVLDREKEIREMRILNYITRVVNRYKDNPVVSAWQVENEPFLDFGICPKLDADFLDREIALVRSLSDKPIVVTDGGEMGLWFRAYKRSDIFGSTLYRTVWNKFWGQITYPLPPSFFRLKRGAMEHFYGEKPMVIIELQAEPWGPRLIQDLSLEEQLESMNPDEFEEVLEYIKGAGFDTFYFWGVEWWYWLKETQNRPEMWNMAKEAIQNATAL